jgi:flagellar motor switch protein FliN
MTDNSTSAASSPDNDWEAAGLPLDKGKPGQSAIRDHVDIEMIQDVQVTLSLEVGRTRISIRNLLQLNQGSVVELDRSAGEPLDLYVNGTLFAHGEVVVVNDKFGVRVTDVVNPSERVSRLR